MSNNNQTHHHVLLLACPAQGHINPTLQLAKRLSRAGLRVTFATTANPHRPINFPSNLDRLSFASFTTGFDDGVKPLADPKHVEDTCRRVGSKSVHDLIVSLSNQDRPISLLIYTLMLPWAADVARELHVPSAFLCIQSAVAFAIYNRFFNGRNNKYGGDNIEIELPGLPLFESRDLPTFLLRSSPHYFVLPTFEDHIRALEMDPNPTVLVNSFDALEEPAIMAVNHDHRIKMITIGPLIPSAFSDQSDPSDTFYGCDLFDGSRDYLSWLGSKADKSVVYVSFGTMVVMERKFFEEILHGLGLTKRPFLWVVRPITHYKMLGADDEVVIEDILKSGLGPIGGPKDQGFIIPWCSQAEVLSHPAIGCFLTHCGWNSILESIVMGVPMVGIPLISDQPTNAKMVEEVWRVGLRAKANEEGVVKRDEIKRCVEVVMDDNEEIGIKIRECSKKWMKLALKAVTKGGSSNNNLTHFLQDLQNIQIQDKNVENVELLECVKDGDAKKSLDSELIKHKEVSQVELLKG